MLLTIWTRNAPSSPGGVRTLTRAEVLIITFDHHGFQSPHGRERKPKPSRTSSQPRIIDGSSCSQCDSDSGVDESTPEGIMAPSRSDKHLRSRNQRTRFEDRRTVDLEGQGEYRGVILSQRSPPLPVGESCR